MKPEDAVALVREQLEDQEKWPTGMPFGLGVFTVDAVRAILAGFEAAAVPDSVISAVEEVKHAVAYNGHAELSRACSELWRVWDNWRGPEPGGLSEEALRDATEMLGGPPDGFIICGPEPGGEEAK